MELLKADTGIDVMHVPYKGVGPAMSDLLGGHVMSMVSNVASAKPHIDAGKLRALGVTSRKRAPALPDVPSIAEAGVKDYEVLNWFGMFAPAGTPAPIITRMHAEAKALLDDAGDEARLASEGAEPMNSTPADFTAFVKSEMQQWSRSAARRRSSRWISIGLFRGPRMRDQLILILRSARSARLEGWPRAPPRPSRRRLRGLLRVRRD